MTHLSSPYAQSVLLIPMTGVAGSTSFVDLTGKTVGVIGSPAISEAQSKFGGSSGLFAGGTNRLELSLPALASSYTIEVWLWLFSDPSTISGPLLRANGGNDYLNVGFSSGVLHFGGVTSSVAASVIPYTQWVHLRILADGTNVSLWVNDTFVGYVSGNAARSNCALQIGGTHDVGGVNAYIQYLHIISGALVRTSITEAPSLVSLDEVSPSQVNTVASLPGDPVPAPSCSRITTQVARDAYYDGRGYITATVKIKGSPDVPVARRVKLHETLSGNLVRETWSDAAGNYTFIGIDPANTYYAVAFDHTGVYQGVVADKLTPTVL